MDKKIKKLLEKSQVITNKQIDLSEEDVKDYSLEEFIKIKAKSYYNQDTNCFYKMIGTEWFRLKQEKPKTEDSKEIYAWCHKLNNSINQRFEELSARIQQIEAKQEAFFKEFKEYIDLKLKKI